MTALQRAYRRWRQANTAAASAREALRSAVEQALADGMSQSDVARVLGWPRQHVNRLLRGR